MKKKRSIGITVFAIIILLISGFSISIHIPLLNSNVQQAFRTQTEKQVKELLSQIKVEPSHSSISPEDREAVKARIKKTYPQMEQHKHEELARATQKTLLNQTMVTLIYSILVFISGIPIFLRRNWGRLSFLSIIILKFLFDVSRLIFTGAHIDSDLNSVFFNIIIPILIILGSSFYLTRPKVTQQFR